MKINQKRYLSAKGVAVRYDIGISTVWQWAKDGNLPEPVRFGNRCTRWDESILNEHDKKLEGDAA